MDMLSGTVARVLYSVPFAIFGLMHFMKGNQMAGFVPSWVPGGVLWVYVTGLALIAAAVSFMIQKQVRLAAFGLAAMLVIFVLTIHLPAVMGGNEMQMSSVLKDLSLAGAALAFAKHWGE